MEVGVTIRVVLLAALCLTFPVLCSSQVAQNAEVSGVVTDPAHRMIPAATVTIRNTQTNVIKTALTNSVGAFYLQLSPSNYEIRVTANGFSPLLRTGVVLDVGQKVDLNLSLSVGSAAQTVTVSSGSEALQNESASVGSLITGEEIARLPVNGRNYTRLILLSPGVSSVQTAQADGTVSGTNLFSVNGQREQDNNYTLDGVDNNFFHFSSPGASPPMDSIAEFRVATDNSAEYGRSMGASVSLITKSGTNRLHGSLYEYLRNGDLDANDWFAKLHGLARPRYAQNQYGATLGGPVVLPKLFDGHDRLFFFMSYEGFRSAKGSTSISTVPTVAERGGDFTALGRNIYNPFTGAPGTKRQPFPTPNVIPKSMLDPAVQYYLNALVPLPNLPGITNNLINTQSQYTNRSIYNGRLDYTVNSHNQIFFRALNQSVSQNSPSSNTFFVSNTQFDVINYALGWTSTLSPQSVLDVRIGYNAPQGPTSTLNKFGIKRDGFLAASGIQLFQPDTPYNVLPAISASGDFSVSESDGTSVDQVLEYSAVYNRQLKASTLKVGIDIQPRHYLHNAANPDSGQAVFTQALTNSLGDATSGSSTASLLLGFPSTVSKGSGGTDVHGRQVLYGVFGQYDWHPIPHLTVNAGIRYDFFKPVYDINDHLGTLWVHQVAGVWTGSQLWAGNNPLTGAGPQQGGFGRGLQVTDYTNFSPRLGIEYQVGPLTVVRAGYGIYYDTGFFQESQDKRKEYPYDDAQNFSLNNTGLPTVNLETPASSLANQLGGYANQPTNRAPFSNQFNLAIQHQFPAKIVSSIAYVGSINRRQIGYLESNTAPVPGPGALGPRRLLCLAGDPIGCSYGDLTLGINGFSSNYHALQLQATRRYSNGMQFNANYTYGKSLDYQSSLAEWKDQNPYDIRADYSRSSYDLTHIFNFSFVYDLPYGRGRQFGSSSPKIVDAIAGGWSIEGINRLQTGAPENVASGTDRANIGTSVQRPNCTGNPNAGPKTINQWFNKAAFSLPAPYTFGTCGAFVVDSPGLKQIDASLYKRFSLWDAQTLDFRAEFFNLPNTPSFGPPNTSFNSTAFGTITAVSVAAREIQMSLRYTF
jgi:outer membrane receptor protein involved in Fe transport